MDSDIEIELNKISGKLHNSELRNIKDEITNDTKKDACFLKPKAYCNTSVKGEEKRS